MYIVLVAAKLIDMSICVLTPRSELTVVEILLVITGVNEVTFEMRVPKEGDAICDIGLDGGWGLRYSFRRGDMKAFHY